MKTGYTKFLIINEVVYCVIIIFCLAFFTSCEKTTEKRQQEVGGYPEATFKTLMKDYEGPSDIRYMEVKIPREAADRVEISGFVFSGHEPGPIKSNGDKGVIIASASGEILLLRLIFPDGGPEIDSLDSRSQTFSKEYWSNFVGFELLDINRFKLLSYKEQQKYLDKLWVFVYEFNGKSSAHLIVDESIDSVFGVCSVNATSDMLEGYWWPRGNEECFFFSKAITSANIQNQLIAVCGQLSQINIERGQARMARD